MKKSFITALILVLFFSGSIFAQIPFKLGIRGGIDIGSLSFDPEPQGADKSSRTGFKFGALAEFGFVPMFALQIELMYAQKGVKFEGPGGIATFKVSVIEIPVLLKLRIPTPGGVIPYVFAGPNIAFVMSANQELEVQGQTQETDLKDQTSATNFGLDLGAGIEFKVAPLTSIIIDGRYSLGFTDLEENTAQTVKTRDIQIVAGVMFGL